MIDTTSDQDLRLITQKLRPTERFLIRLLAEGSKLVDELSAAIQKSKTKIVKSKIAKSISVVSVV